MIGSGFTLVPVHAGVPPSYQMSAYDLCVNK